MRPENPPRFATLLLKAFTDNEPLVGDLHEEYHAGRSRAWYWRQALMAVFVAPLRRGDVHELFAVQGVFMQVVMLALISVCAVFTMKFMAVVMFDDAVTRMLVGPRGAREFVRVVVSFALAMPIGLAIARVHAWDRRAAVLAFSTTMALWAFVNLYLLNGVRNLDSALPHVVASLMFIVGLLAGGIHLDLMLRSDTSATS
jgi:hypothetical protein